VKYVLETPPFVYIQSQKIINSVIGSLEEEAKKVYDQVNKEDQKYNVLYKVVTLEGHPVTSVIIEYSEDKDFLNIIGSTGHEKFKAAILGSVSFHIFNHIKKPVTLVK
jgi:nucleotide-binding universal stress UspA family protein